MSFCDHCQGQRFDRAQVLRTLRAAHKRLAQSGSAADCDAGRALALAIEAVRTLEIPHLDPPDEIAEDEVIH